MVIDRLNTALDQIPFLRLQRHDSKEFDEWYRDTEVAIEHFFGSTSKQVKEFTCIPYSLCFTTSYSDTNYQDDYLAGLDDAEVLLKSIKKEVTDFYPAQWSISKVAPLKQLPGERFKTFFRKHCKFIITSLIAILGVAIAAINACRPKSSQTATPQLVNNPISADNQMVAQTIIVNNYYHQATVQANTNLTFDQHYRHNLPDANASSCDKIVRLERNNTGFAQKELSRLPSSPSIFSNAVLYAPMSLDILHKKMSEAYNSDNTTNAVPYALQGLAIWNNLMSVYSNETVLIDAKFINTVSRMLTVKAESLMFQRKYSEAISLLEQSSQLVLGNTITNDAFMVATAQLASRDSLVGNIISSYYNKSDSERFAFGNLLAQMGYLFPYKIGQDDKGRQFYTSIDIVKTLHLTNAVQYPFMIRFRNAGAENLIVVPRWIGLNQYEPLHLDSVAYEKQRKEFELSHLLNDQTNSVNTDPTKR